MIGIYKITNPKGKSYIGKTKDWERRIREYKKNILSSTKEDLSFP